MADSGPVLAVLILVLWALVAAELIWGGKPQ